MIKKRIVIIPRAFSDLTRLPDGQESENINAGFQIQRSKGT